MIEADSDKLRMYLFESIGRYLTRTISRIMDDVGDYYSHTDSNGFNIPINMKWDCVKGYPTEEILPNTLWIDGTMDGFCITVIKDDMVNIERLIVSHIPKNLRNEVSDMSQLILGWVDEILYYFSDMAVRMKANGTLPSE